MVNLEALHVMVQNLQSMVTEIKDDGKKTLAQAQTTNGRVTKTEGAIEALDKRLKELENNKKTLVDWFLRLLIAAFGAQTVLGQLAAFAKHLLQ